MKSFLILALFAAAALVSGQQFTDILFIDDFVVETPTIIIIIPSNPSFPISEQRSTQDNQIIGGERNLRLTALTGSSNLVLSSGVAAGDFTCSTPNQASGESLLQWDGVDGDISLTANGLGGIDFTQSNGESFRTLIESDISTTIVFRVYSGSSSAVCTRTVSIPGDDTTNEYILNFSSFSGSCSFSNVGAVEVSVNMLDNVDVLLELFSTYGPVPVTPSSTRTQTPTARPTPSPTPAPSNTCVCRCPIFTCEVFRVDDGDYYFYNNFFDTFFNPGFFNFGFFNNFFGAFFFFQNFFGNFFFFQNYFFDIWYGWL